MSDYHSVRDRYARDENGRRTYVAQSSGSGNLLKIALVIGALALGFFIYDAFASGRLATQVANMPPPQAGPSLPFAQPQAQPPAVQQNPAPQVLSAQPEGPTPVPTMFPVPAGSSDTSVSWFARADGTKTAQIGGAWYCTPHAMNDIELWFFAKALREDPGHRARFACGGQ